MAQQKQPIGFRTPSKDLNDAFSKIQDNLSKQKADWQAINQELIDALFTGKTTLGDDKLNSNAVMIILTFIHVAKLGIEMTEIHERLAKLEKAVKESK